MKPSGIVIVEVAKPYVPVGKLNWNVLLLHDFVLSVYDQNGNTISNMPDYLMHIQFIIRKVDETKLILNKVLVILLSTVVVAVCLSGIKSYGDK